jgi:hypothetical protein
MNKATITKTIKKVDSQDTGYSLGFRRLHALPVKARKAFNLACFAEGVDASDVHSEQKSFLESLSDEEFKNWLAVNA